MKSRMRESCTYGFVRGQCREALVYSTRQDGAVEEELQAFITGSGLDSSLDTLSLGKSYYSFTEPKTGDLFIFMSLEGGYRPAQYDEFTEEQLDWVEALLEEKFETKKQRLPKQKKA